MRRVWCGVLGLVEGKEKTPAAKFLASRGYSSEKPHAVCLSVRCSVADVVWLIGRCGLVVNDSGVYLPV